MMDGGAPLQEMSLDHQALGQLMPMHLVVSPTGHIRSVGPTMAKICGQGKLIGARFLELFEIRRPRNVTSAEDLLLRGNRRMSLALRQPPKTGFKGMVVPLLSGRGILVNLSFGIAMAEAVRDHQLSISDFAATDLTVEMLYVIEAKTVVLSELNRLNQRLNGAKQQAEALALTDTVTGLSNRRAMGLALDRLVRSGVAFSLMSMDLDFFKQVNDTLGHAAGDYVLEQVARILTEETRGRDTVARVGGDEFVLIFPELTDQTKLTSLCLRILAKLEEPIAIGDREARISASMGTTMTANYDRPDPEQMLQDADEALYTSKRRGRQQATIFEPGKGAAAAAG